MSERGSNGIVIGVVHDLEDPDQLGRVRVKFPHLGHKVSDWARVVAPMAGPGRGFFFRPEKGDEVVVVFEHNDHTRPYVVGAVWSRKQPPPDGGDAAENNWRFIRSRSGHVIRLDDTDGGERIEIIDKDGSRRIVIDSAGGKVQVTCDSGDVEVRAGGGTVSVQATTVTLKASGSMSIEAGADLTIKGATVNIN